MEECVFSGDDESQMTSVSYTPRSGEFELNENFIILESDEKSAFRSKCDTYEISATFFCRLLSLVYFFSFLASMNQVLGLFGSKGIYDMFSNTSSFLNNLNSKSFYEALSEFPSVFLVMPISDFTLKLVPLVGLVTSFLMFLTGFNCMYSFLFLWVLKLSMVALFKTLPKTASDLLLLEVGFLAIFIFSPFKFFDKQTNFEVPTLVKWSFRFLTYRVVLLSGVYKVFLLKKVDIQHILMSIPLPTFFNYYLVGLVSHFKFFNVFFTSLLIFFEVVLSVFLVTPYRSCRLFGGMSTLVYSIVLTLLGNFGPFYLLLMLSSLFCLDDQYLHVFANWKYNPFCKSDRLMRKVSVDLVDNIFDSYPQADAEAAEDLENHTSTEDRLSVRMMNNAEYNNVEYSNNDGDDNSFGGVYFERVMSNLNYSRHGECIREFMNIDDKLSGNLFSECFKKVLKDLLLLFYLTSIAVLALLLFLFNNYRGLKAFLLFLFAVLLKSHCETVKTRITFLQGQYTLFFLQGLLIFEMLKNGPNTWSFLLWIALVELQLNLSKKVENFNYLTRMIIQSFLFTHLVLYNSRIFHSSFKEVLYKPTLVKSSGVSHFNNYDTNLNSFYTINNYKNVYPVNNARLEVVVQGTGDDLVTTNTQWSEYYFKKKPSKLDRFPHFVPFYQYILDEQLVVTFNTKFYSKLLKPEKDPDHGDQDVRKKKPVKEKYLVKDNDGENPPYDDVDDRTGGSKEHKEDQADEDAAESKRGDSVPEVKKNLVDFNDKYVFDVLKRLLVGSNDLNSLLLYNPFAAGKPKYMRILLYKYHFSNMAKGNSEKHRENTSHWYDREFVCELVPPLSYTPPKVTKSENLSKEHDVHSKDSHGRSRKEGGKRVGDFEKDGGVEMENGPTTYYNGENKVAKGVDGDNTGVNNGDTKVVHVVHTMPPANHKTVPLSMADSFNHTIPKVDGMVITSK